MSPHSSGKQTPAGHNVRGSIDGRDDGPTGDFAAFLQAEELKEKLAKEQEELIKSELKAAKRANKAREGLGSSGGGTGGHHGHGGGVGPSLSGHGLGGRGKPETPEERFKRRQAAQQATAAAATAAEESAVPDGPTLEERGYFPGDLLHSHSHKHHHHHHHEHASNRKSTVKQPQRSNPSTANPSANTSPVLETTKRLRPPALCGPDVSESEDETETRKARRRSREGTKATSNASSLLGEDEVGIVSPDGFHLAEDDDDVDNDDSLSTSAAAGVTASSSSAAAASAVESSSGSSSVGSSSSDIVSPHRRPNASVISLKSYESDQTNGAGSLASGGANAKLARPLLELEELELESFLKNFGRHTREVRVPQSANFPQRRMPRWEDFRVPRGEAALAASQGKRVTVLTHVDRGLKALEEVEGEGGPKPRGGQDGADGQQQQQQHHHHGGLFHRKEKHKDREKEKDVATTPPTNEEPKQPVPVSSTAASPVSERTANLGTPPTSTSPSSPTKSALGLSHVPVHPLTGSSSISSTTGGGGGGLQQRVSWAPNVEKKGSSSSATDYGKSSHQPASPAGEIGSSSALSRFLHGASGKHAMDKDERAAKKQEKAGAGPSTSALAEQAGQVDVHDEHVEWRPSRDEVGLNDEEWEILHHGDEEVHVADERALDAEDADREDDRQVDGIAWAIAYILATIERYAPEELDNTPDQTYRESRTRSHIERLYLIAPFWERLLYGVRRVYRWDDPRRTSTFAMGYFTLWYMDLLPTAFLLMIMFYVCQFRFFPPSASFLHEQVRMRMARGVDADRLAERLRRRSRLDVLELYKRFVVAYGSETQLAAGDVADFHEKVKNLILWRNPRATWRTLCLLGASAVFVTFASPHLVWKTVFAFFGFTFFILLPLQSHYPRFRRPLSPIWWALWGSPTDAQFAIQLLRRRHLERQHAKHPPLRSAAGRMAAAVKTNGRRGDASGAGDVVEGELNEDDRDSAFEAQSGFKGKLLRHSSAAQAVAYGALRPFRSSSEGGFGMNGRRSSTTSENLLDLQDVKVLEGGQVMSKPRKLGSFFCQHHGVPGHLHVTTRMLYFVALHSYATNATSKSKGGRKTCKTTLSEISGLVKTKSIKLLVWNSQGLQITRRNKSSLFFSNMPHRDNAFNLLLAVGSEVWHKHT